MGFGKAQKQARNRRKKLDLQTTTIQNFKFFQTLEDSKLYSLSMDPGKKPLMGGLLMTGREWKEFYREYSLKYRNEVINFTTSLTELTTNL